MDKISALAVGQAGEDSPSGPDGQDRPTAFGDHVDLNENWSQPFRSYVDHARLLIRGAVALYALSRQAQRLGLAQSEEELDLASTRLQNGSFSIAVVGDFKRGKSTFVNALLGSAALPTDALPATATVTRVVYGREPEARLLLHDGRNELVPIAELGRHITKIDEEAERRSFEVREAIVAYPTLFCQNNVEIVDTPGLSDDQAMTRLTLDVIPKADAVVLVVSALSPFSATEAAFLEYVLQTVDIGQIFFVLSHIDAVKSPGDCDRLVADVERRILERVERARPGALANAALRLYPVSAWLALQAKKNHDGDLYSASRLPAFERSLETYLARDKGAAALRQVMQIVQQNAAEISTAIVAKTRAVIERNNGEELAANARMAELQDLVTAIASHLDGFPERAKRREESVRDTIASELRRVQEECAAVLRRIELSDAHLSDTELRATYVHDTLADVAFPTVRGLCADLAHILRSWARDEDAVLEEIKARLDAALNERRAILGSTADLPVHIELESKRGIVAALATQECSTLDGLVAEFEAKFRPSGLLAAPTLGMAGRVLGNDTVQEGYRKLRGFFQTDGAQRADAELRETRDQIRERLRRAYAADAVQHLAGLFGAIDIAPKSLAAVGRLLESVWPILEHEREYIGKLTEWCQIEIRIERTRQQTANMRDRTEFAAMGVETRKILERADRDAALLAQALRSRTDTAEPNEPPVMQEEMRG